MNPAERAIVENSIARPTTGTVFKEEVIARNYDEARQVALARNPNARVVSVNAKF